MLEEIRTQVMYFLKNKLFILSGILSAILGYGYLWTHSTCGIDDVSIDLYFENGIGVAIGRWPYYLVNKIIPIAEYTPFIGDFITVVVMLFAAIIWCVLLRMIIRTEISIWAYVAFVFMFMDYSINADIMMFYLQNGIGWVHLFSVLSLICFWKLHKGEKDVKKQIITRCVVVGMLTIAIGFYESAANIFLTGALIVILLDLFVEKGASAFRGKGFLRGILFVARYLIYAMIARRGIRAIIMHIFPITPYALYRNVSKLEWLTKGSIEDIWNKIGNLLAQIYCDYFAMGVVYYPIFIFVMTSLVYLFVLVIFSCKRKDFMLLFVGMGMYASVFTLCFIEGCTIYYRACQTFVIFVAVAFFAITIGISQVGMLKRICVRIVIVILITYSVYDMNQWFVLDYEKTEYEMQVINQIATELLNGNYNLKEKPVVFVGRFELTEEIYNQYCIGPENFGWKIVAEAVMGAERYLEKRYSYEQSSNSIIDWSVHAFGTSCGYNIPIHQLFEYQGYKFVKADDTKIKEVFDMYYIKDWEERIYYVEEYNGAAEYPATGYIEEMDDCIVIRL